MYNVGVFTLTNFNLLFVSFLDFFVLMGFNSMQ